ncbi:MAG: hypothetical protein ACI4AK_06690 [Lepagella sp.]
MNQKTRRTLNRTIVAITITLIATISYSCGGSRSGETQESATQIEQARESARNAARRFVNREIKDTFELQTLLVEAASERSAYDSLPQSRAAFDSTFISTVRTVRPEVAEELQRHLPGKQ